MRWACWRPCGRAACSCRINGRRPHVVWKRFLAKPGRKFRLSQVDPGDTAGFKSKETAQKRLQKGLESLCDLQDKLYAQDRYALLLVFQAMDAAGKDSTIRHVMSGVDPAGCQVFSF